MQKVAILLPCFNESQLILKFNDQLIQNIRELPYSFEIVYINDGSTDTTSERIKEITDTHSNINITLLDLNFNMGHQGAIYQGLLYIQSHQFNYAIIMDSDGEDDPAAISELLKNSNYDLVQVVRGKRKENRFFKIFYSIYKFLFSIMIGKKLNFGNYSLITPKLIDCAVEFSFVHLAAFLNNQRCTKTQITSNRKKRLDGSSKMNFTGLFYHAINSFVENARDLLFVFIKISLVLLLVIIIMIGVVLYKKFISFAAIQGWSSTLITSLFNSFLICIGIFVTGALQLNILSKKGSSRQGRHFANKIIVKNWQ